MPVIKAGTFELFVVNMKAHRFNKVEPCTGCGAGSGNVSGVLRNLRFNENNVERSQVVSRPFGVQIH